MLSKVEVPVGQVLKFRFNLRTDVWLDEAGISSEERQRDIQAVFTQNSYLKEQITYKKR